MYFWIISSSFQVIQFISFFLNISTKAFYQNLEKKTQHSKFISHLFHFLPFKYLCYILTVHVPLIKINDFYNLGHI